MPEKYVRIVKDKYEETRTQVKTSVGVAGMIIDSVWLHQISSLSPQLFDCQAFMSLLTVSFHLNIGLPLGHSPPS